MAELNESVLRYQFPVPLQMELGQVIDRTPRTSGGLNVFGLIDPYAPSECSSTSSQTSSYTSETDQLVLDAEGTMEIVKCKCNHEPPCIHRLAIIGNLVSLKKLLIYDAGLTDVERNGKDKELCSIDAKYRNVLHYAAEFRGNSIANQMVRELVKTAYTRLSTADYFNFVNALDKNRLTPLYISAKVKNVKACRFLLTSRADLDIINDRGKTPAIKVFKKIPEVMRDVIQSIDSVTFADGNREKVRFDFSCVMGVPTQGDLLNSPSLYEEMDFIANISYTPIVERHLLLDLPIVRTLVWLKWQKLAITFWVARFFQILWFLLYFIYLITIYRRNCPFPSETTYAFTWLSLAPPKLQTSNSSDLLLTLSERNCAGPGWKLLGWLLILTGLIDGVVIEGYPMWVRFRRRWHPMKSKSSRKYFRRFMQLLNMLHPTKLFFLCTIFVNTAPVQFRLDPFSLETQYAFASIGVFLCWFQIFLQIGKIPSLKGYTKMLRNVVCKISIVGMLYASLIVAFGVTFCILMPGVASFASPLEAVLRMYAFSIGEIEFENRFYGDPASIPAAFIVTLGFYGLAVLILHLALLNFLIGLTSIDIQDTHQYSKMWETYTYVSQIYLLETFLSRFPFGWGQKYLRGLMVIPQKYRSKKDLEDAKFIYEIKLDKIPKSIRKGLYEDYLFKDDVTVTPS